MLYKCTSNRVSEICRMLDYIPFNVSNEINVARKVVNSVVASSLCLIIFYSCIIYAHNPFPLPSCIISSPPSSSPPSLFPPVLYHHITSLPPPSSTTRSSPPFSLPPANQKDPIQSHFVRSRSVSPTSTSSTVKPTSASLSVTSAVRTELFLTIRDSVRYVIIQLTFLMKTP